MRHLYFLQVMKDHFEVKAAFLQKKTGHPQTTPASSALFQRHFRKLNESEAKEFASPQPPQGIMAREVAEINEPSLVECAKVSQVDVVLLFGTAILQPFWLDNFPGKIINLHLGLSPYYRGVATLFWPFAQNEMECVGTTIHLAVSKVDAGPILAQFKAEFKVGDDYYSLSNRLIRQTIDRMPSVVNDYLAGRIQPVPQPPAPNRAWRQKDFSESALSRMLKLFGSGLTASQIAKTQRSQKCPCLQ